MSSAVAFTDAVVLGSDRPNAVIFWLHGLGADGHDFEPIVAELNFAAKAQTQFIFPHAPMRPVTINNGYVMRAWYDLLALDRTAAEDEAGIRASAAQLGERIAAVVANGVAAKRIVLAGFSQGGAIVLHAGLRYPAPLAGILALSTYLPLSTSVPQEKQTGGGADSPIFMAHGRYDDIIPLEFAENAQALMQQQACHVEWHEYPMSHSICSEEITDIDHWLDKVLPVE